MKDIIPISQWSDHEISGKIIIAGPCSAESPDQLMKTAKALAASGKVNWLRAGIWKPRTRPGSFQGVGVEGLKWLNEVKSKTGLPVMTEVASPQHVEECLKHNVDAVWIGARTVSNPFSVHQIADALKGADIPVLVKNPLSPDLEMWIGAIERVYNAGIRKIGAIHRGFFPYEKARLRNVPKWEIAIELKTQFPTLPVICDPSHMAGKKAYIFELSQYAMDLSFDGLIIEVHHNPAEALSDKAQQLTPDEFFKMLETISFKKSDITPLETSIKTLRSGIDSIDFQLVDLLAARMDLVEKIGRIKKENDITIFQLKRWKDIIETRMKAGQGTSLSNDFLYRILEIIHQEAIRIQSEMKKED